MIYDGPAVLGRLPEVSAIYRAAFTAPGYDETDADVARFASEQLPLHCGREGFRLAMQRGGFAYGYTGRPGQWWTDAVRQAAPGCADLLDGHFEVVCLAVAPVVQRRGVGQLVMEELLAGLTQPRAMLTASSSDLPAPRLYARLGFVRLASEVLPGSDLWSRDLPL